MAKKFSTGLRNYMLGEGSFRKCFEDAIVRIYSGAPPATADAAATGVLLVELTKSGLAVDLNERSTPRVYRVVVGSHGSGETFIFNVTVDGVGPTSYTYTNSPDLDLDGVCRKVAEMLNDVVQIDAIPSNNADGVILVKSRIDGLAFTLADGGGTGTITSITKTLDEVRQDGLQFGNPSAAKISKETAAWQGSGLVNGTAGYFRLVRTTDTGVLSTTEERFQGQVATSGAEMNLANTTNIVAGVPITIDQFDVSLPVGT